MRGSTNGFTNAGLQITKQMSWGLANEQHWLWNSSRNNHLTEMSSDILPEICTTVETRPPQHRTPTALVLRQMANQNSSDGKEIKLMTENCTTQPANANYQKILFQHFIRISFYRVFNFTRKGNKDMNISDAHSDAGKSSNIRSGVIWSDTAVSAAKFSMPLNRHPATKWLNDHYRQCLYRTSHKWWSYGLGTYR